MNEESVSPISSVPVSYQGVRHMHWEGHLKFGEFMKAYWGIVWTGTTIWSKIYFLSCFAIFYFPSILFQFVFKKIFCLLYNLRYKNQAKKPSSANQNLAPTSPKESAVKKSDQK